MSQIEDFKRIIKEQVDNVKSDVRNLKMDLINMEASVRKDLSAEINDKIVLEKRRVDTQLTILQNNLNRNIQTTKSELEDKISAAQENIMQKIRQLLDETIV